VGKKQLTTHEAKLLIEMDKRSTVRLFNLPERGESHRLHLRSEYKHEFTAEVYRKNRGEGGCIQGMLLGGQFLLRVDITPNKPHRNPGVDGKKVEGSHYHIYDENSDDSIAYPLVGELDMFTGYEKFAEMFTVVDPPEMHSQIKIDD
jgi:hypothetical protein